MAVQLTRKVLNIFLASPGDLADERKLAREVVEEINRCVRLLGWYIELLGWEDTLPGFSRPQHIINRDVDLCDLFVGLLWRRWGQATGEYDSGFEEEFELAKRRHLTSGCPEIWLCFKRVDPEQMEDPGDQLKRVITFRKSLEETKELLFKEFRNSEDWKVLFREWLLSYIINLHQSSLGTQAVASAVLPVPQLPETSQSAIIQQKADQGSMSSQILETFSTVSDAITQGEFDSITLTDGEVSGGVFSAARAYLFGVSWLAALNTGELLGTHAINLLFLHRKELQTTPVERFVISRTVIGDTSEVVPGWFWNRHWNGDITETILFDRSLRDSNWLVRQQALELLNAGGIPAKDAENFTKKDFIQAILRDDSQSVTTSALKYLASYLDPDELPILRDAISENPSIARDKALEAEELIILRKGQSAEIAKLIPSLKSPSKEIITELEKRLDQLDEGTLHATLQHADASLRSLSLSALLQKDNLATDDVKHLVNDSSSTVKRDAYKELIKRGVAIEPEEIRKALPNTLLLDFLGFSDRDSLILELFKSRDYDQLLSMIDWFSLDGPLAYKTLAIHHFNSIATRLRSDLDAGFENVRVESITKLKPHGPVADVIIKTWSEKNIDTIMQKDFIAAALAGLAANGEPSDRTIARTYLNDSSDEVRTEAVRILDRFGDASDLEVLVSIAISSWGELQEVAAIAALKLAPGPDGAARSFLESDKSKLVALAVRSLFNESDDKVRPILEPLLQSKNGSTRLNVLFYFMKRCQNPQLEELLETYLGQATYYYNVVCWLDRILYAPPPLRDSFRRELERRFSD